MPRINRIRVTNIKYDQHKKQMPDITLDLGAEDAIFLLANGGGKSLLIQLILQTVLPNARMGKRRIADLLRGDSYTGHVVVEWLLDHEGEAAHYLCTGFCFTAGYGESALRYYNYLFDYEEGSELSITELPLIKSNTQGELFGRDYPIQYLELKDWLRDHQEQRIEIFERVKDYQSRLRRYRILPEEWENIRETNASEGGVDEFFARSSTAQQLLDNLLIPSVEKMIFKEQEKRKQLFRVFAEYRNLLLEIPKIEVNIKDFKVISEEAEELVEEVRGLHSLSTDFEESTLDLLRLGKTFAQHSQEAEEKLLKLVQEEQSLEGQAGDLEWQLASYKLFLEQLKCEELVEQESRVREKYQSQQQRVEKIEQRLNRLQAFVSFNQLQESEAERDKYKYKLEILNDSAPELKEKLTLLQGQLLKAWLEEKERLIKGQTGKEENLATLNKELIELSEEQKSLAQLEDKYREQRAGLKAWLQNYKDEKNKLTQLVEKSKLKNPRQALADYQEELSELDNRVEGLELKLHSLEEEYEELSEEIIDKYNQRSWVQKELEIKENSWVQFKEESELIEGRLAYTGKYFNCLLSEQEEIILYSRQELAESREKRANSQAELANLEEKWALFAHRDYYLPHSELLKVKEILEQEEIYTVLGSEWLAYQELSVAEKEAYLSRQPLLPYSILIEERQLNKVKRILRQDNKLSPDFPLLFLIKSGESLLEVGPRENFLALQSGEIFIYQPESKQVFISETAFIEFKAELEQRLVTKREELKEYEEQEALKAQLKEKIEEFYRRYDLAKVESWRDEIEQYQERIAILEEQLSKAEERKEELKKVEQTKKQNLLELKAAAEQQRRIIEQLSDFVQLTEQKFSEEEKLEDANSKLESLKSRVNNLEQQREELRAEQMEIKERLNEYSRSLEQHQQDLIEYGLRELSPAEESSRDYRELKNEVGQLIERLNRSQGEREEIEVLVNKLATECRKLENQLQKLGFERSWLSENSRQVSGLELEEAREKLDWAREKEQELRDSWIKSESQLEAAQKHLENLWNRVEEESGRAPYFDFSRTDHQQQEKLLKSSLVEIKEGLKELQQETSKAEQWQRINRELEEEVAYIFEGESRGGAEKAEPMSAREWESYDLEPKEIFRNFKEGREGLEKELGVQKQEVKGNFQSYLRKLQSTNNPKVRHFARKIKQIMENEKLYDYDYVETRFIQILEGLEAQRRYYQQQLEEREQDMKHLTDLSLRRAREVYESVMEIPKNSRVDLFGRRIQIIKIDWEILEAEEGREAIYDYLSQVLIDLQNWKEAGRDDDEIDAKMEELLQTRNLIDVIAPVEKCRVRVFKPRSESIVRNNQLEYADWSAVSRWSGGEEYSIYITMFMIMISHIREQIEGRGRIWKTVVADNPFGKASSPHILKTVFGVARANRIQLLCFTAHRQDSILKEFPVLYSLKLRSAYGKEVLQSERMETAFYNLAGS